MTTVTIEQVNERGVKPEGAGWANYSQNYVGPRPLVAGRTYDVEIKPWKDTWFLNKATEAGVVHQPPPAPAALPPAVDLTGGNNTVTLPPPPVPASVLAAALPPVVRDETRASIERQVCLKAAVETWDAKEWGWNPDEVLNAATKFYDWVSDQSVPPSSQAEHRGYEGDGGNPDDPRNYGEPGGP